MEEMARDRILNVDDNEAGRYSVTRILTQAGFEVVEAATGSEALNLALKFPDLVLLDVNLPDINGFEVCRRLKSDPATRAIPILHLSATYKDSKATVNGLDGGADGYLTQPVEPPVLLAHVKAHIRSSRLERRLARSNRSLKALSYCNQALLRAQSGFELVQEVCRILVEVGGYRFVWAGAGERDAESSVRPIASWGDDQGLLEMVTMAWDETAAGCCPEGEAIRTGKPFLLKDIRTDSRCEPWRAEALKRGFISAFALPLIMGGDVWGAVSICTDRTGIFDDEERELLLELAQDLSYGLETLRTREQARRAHEALQESEERYRMLFESAGDAIYILDTGGETPGKIVSANPAAAKMHGYTVDELLNLHIFDLDTPESAAGVLARRERLLRGETLREELTHKRKDGTVFPLEINARLLELGDRKYIFAIDRDLTERKVAEEQLHLKDSAINSSIAGVSILDLDGEVTYANPAALRLWGYDHEEEVLGKLGLGFWITREEAKEAFELAARTGSWVGELVARRKDGSRLELQVAVTLVRNVDGNTLAVMAWYLDISERKRAEEAIKDSEESFRLAFENANIGVCLVDTQGRLIRVNNQMCKIFGYSRSELEAMTVNDIAHPEDLDLSSRFIERARSGEVDDGEFDKRYTHKNGNIIWGQVTSSLVKDLRGNPLYFISHVRDITKQKLAEEALRASEEQNRFLAEVIGNASQPFAVGYPDGRLGFVNRAFCELTGYSEEELRQIDWNKTLTPPEWRESETRYLAELVRTGTPVRYEKEYIRKDGSRVPIELLVHVVRDETGQPDHFQAFLIDQTERKHAEEALRESETRYRYLVENIEDLICTHDLQGNLLFVSPGPAHLLGYAVEDMVGKNLRSFLAPEVQGQLDAYLASIERDGRASGHMLVLTRTGEKRLWECHSKLHTPPDGVPIVLGIARDVTERKRAEDALRESQQRYQALFDDSRDGVFVTSREGQLIEANQAYFDLFGYTKKEMIETDVRVLYADPSDRERFVRAIESSGFLKGYPLTLRTRDGKEVECLVTSSLSRKQDGTIIGYHGIVRDMTEQTNLQKQLFQAQKMEAVGTLAGGVAHDFNNVLQVALGYSELMLADEGLPRNYRADLRKIHESARRGADLVQRVLTFSRKTEIKPKPLNLNHRITEMRKMVERTIPKMIGIELLLAEDLVTINADATQVDQVLMNLAVNARDAMPEGGKLIVETANVTLDEDYARAQLEAKLGHYVLLTVRDTGKGMDEETLEHIFEPFYTTKAAGEGTGLGLAMVHGIVQQYGGHIRCESEPGQGTTFKIYLPAVESEEEPEDTITRAMPRGGSETILLVDDEEFILDLGSRILTKAGYKVIKVSNGEEALKVYQQRSNEISLVILDIIMPAMGGKECLKNLLGINPAVKVVIASGYSANGPAKEALAAGAKGFVDKPYDMRQMLETVRTTIDGE